MRVLHREEQIRDDKESSRGLFRCAARVETWLGPATPQSSQSVYSVGEEALGVDVTLRCLSNHRVQS